MILKCVLFEQNMLDNEKMKVEIKHYLLTSCFVAVCHCDSDALNNNMCNKIK